MNPAALLQRRQALASANAARTGMKEVKLALKSGELTPAEALRSEWAPHFKLEAFLVAVPGIGTAKARRMLAQFPANGRPISPSKRLGALTPGQRAHLESCV